MMDKMIPLLGIATCGSALLALGCIFLAGFTGVPWFANAFAGFLLLAFVLGLVAIIAVGIDIARS